MSAETRNGRPVLALFTPADAQRVKVTLNGVYRDMGAAPAPTPAFSLVFEIDRSPLVCGGSTGAFLACGMSRPEYVNGPLAVVLA